MDDKTLDDEAVFNIACRISSAELRADYLDQICHGNKPLKDRVLRLLELNDQNEGFLESPIGGTAPTSGSESIAESVGSMIGRYKLLQVIGEGGFGIVFMAEQQEPVRRRVALKIIKPGMDTREVIARFEADHPAIRGRADHRADGLCAERQRTVTRRNGHGRAAAGAPRGMRRVVRVSCGSRLEIGEFGADRLSQNQGTRIAQPPDNGRLGAGQGPRRQP